MKYSIGNKLTDLRKNSKKTRKEVADALGVAASTLGNWENNTREPSFEMLSKIADYYSVTIGELFGEETKIVENELKETLIEDIIDLLVKTDTLPDVETFDELDKNSKDIIKAAVNKYLEKIKK